MLFFSIQQELDCISDDGDIVGKIKFDDAHGRHIFSAFKDVHLSLKDKTAIKERLAGLDSGKYSIPMQDDD